MARNRDSSSELQTPTPGDESLVDLNARIAAEAAAVTTAEARGGASGGGLVDVTTDDATLA